MSMKSAKNTKYKPKWLCGGKEAEGRKHRMVRVVEGLTKFQCIRCGMRSLYDRVRGVCHGLLWVKENQERGKDTRHRWKDKIVCWHHLQRIVDVGKVRTLIWCRRCADWASEGRLSKRLRSRLSCQPRRLEQGYWLVKNGKLQERGCLSPKSEFQSHCDLHDEGTFMAQCGRWDKMENMWVEIQNGGPDLFDEISEAGKCSIEKTNGPSLGGSVQDKIRFFEVSRKILMCKSRLVLKWTNTLRDLCDVRTFCVKMVTGSKVVAS